jgi:hypothetical protein
MHVNTLHSALFLAAFVLFILAACPTGSRYRFEWFGVACLTLTWIV